MRWKLEIEGYGSDELKAVNAALATLPPDAVLFPTPQPDVQEPALPPSEPPKKRGRLKKKDEPAPQAFIDPLDEIAQSDPLAEVSPLADELPEAPEPAPAIEATPVTETGVTREQLREAFKDLLEKKGPDVCRAVLDKVEVPNLSQLPERLWPDVLKLIKEAS